MQKDRHGLTDDDISTCRGGDWARRVVAEAEVIGEWGRGGVIMGWVDGRRGSVDEVKVGSPRWRGVRVGLRLRAV